ncbi:g8967 [Coccomyxa viridis]|uniref:G8967 protein n=1 Tax=Coccomyxa viridis TaxID=1274662 RepID=A0ABP1G1Q5_9CHLO
MAAARSTGEHGIASRRRQAQAWLCVAVGLIALHLAHADTVTHQPGKIAVDPTSDEDASVELNQSTQLGSTGTTGVNAYPKYADGTKVTSANLNRLATPTVTSSAGGTSQASVSGGAATAQSTPAAAATTSTAAGTNSGTEQLIRSASTAPVLASTTKASSTKAAEGAAQGGVTGMSGGSAGGSPASLTGFLGGNTGAAAAFSGSSGLSAGGGGNSQKPASTGSQSMTGRVTSVGGRKLKL